MNRKRIGYGCEIKHEIQQNKVNWVLVLQVLKVFCCFAGCPGQRSPIAFV